MAEQLPIEDHYGAMVLIKNCWRCEGNAEDWRRAVHQLHGASMASGESLHADLSFLVAVGYQRLEMARTVQS